MQPSPFIPLSWSPVTNTSSGEVREERPEAPGPVAGLVVGGEPESCLLSGQSLPQRVGLCSVEVDAELIVFLDWFFLPWGQLHLGHEGAFVGDGCGYGP